jgi:hypothetical protein
MRIKFAELLATWRPSVQQWEYNAARCNIPLAPEELITGVYPIFRLDCSE